MVSLVSALEGLGLTVPEFTTFAEASKWLKDNQSVWDVSDDSKQTEAKVPMPQPSAVVVPNINMRISNFSGK